MYGKIKHFPNHQLVLMVESRLLVQSKNPTKCQIWWNQFIDIIMVLRWTCDITEFISNTCMVLCWTRNSLLRSFSGETCHVLDDRLGPGLPPSRWAPTGATERHESGAHGKRKWWDSWKCELWCPKCCETVWKTSNDDLLCGPVVLLLCEASMTWNPKITVGVTGYLALLHSRSAKWVLLWKNWIWTWRKSRSVAAGCWSAAAAWFQRGCIVFPPSSLGCMNKSRFWCNSYYSLLIIEGSLETKVPTIWTDEKQHSQEAAEPGRNSDV